MRNVPPIYFIDDEPAIRDSVEQAMLIEGIPITCFPNAVEALQCIDTNRAAIVVTDIHMPVMNGINFTEQLLQRNANFQVIVLTGHGDVQTAVSAMKAGAYDFLEKPFVVDALMTAINKAADKLALVEENHLLRKELAMQTRVGPKLIGQSPFMVALRRELITLDIAQEPIFVFHGDVGTGKRITAQYSHDVHAPSHTELHPIAAFDLPTCSSEEFTQRLIHLGIQAKGGTLYLHQAETLTLKQWQWLLKIKESLIDKKTCNRFATCIIVATTVVPTIIINELRLFKLVPLSSRSEDIGLLFKHFVRGAASRYQLPPPIITQHEVEQLVLSSWKENIKQLRQYAELRALKPSTVAYEQNQEALSTQRIEPSEDSTSDQLSLNQRTDRFEHILLIEALHRHQGRLKEMQQELQISRKTLYDKLRKHQLDKADFKNGQHKIKIN